MGSLPLDTRCAYCDINLAGYIPDGCVGPTCMECFFDLTEEQMIQLRLGRRARPFLILGRVPPGGYCPAAIVLRDPDIARRIAAFLIHV